MQDQNDKPQNARSSFVTVLAWIFIALAAWSTLISVLQNVMVYAISPADLVAASASRGANPLPPIFDFMLRHMRVLLLAFLFASIATLVAAIGVLKRKNWARVVFVGGLTLGILWNVGGFVLQQFLLSSMTALPPDVPTEFRAAFDQMAFAIRVVSAVLMLGLSVLFAWLIKRLLSPTIREEFS